ncbi:MAG: hypothetical protein RLZZ401_20, partial [Pseudomonadota bacterium]
MRTVVRRREILHSRMVLKTLAPDTRKGGIRFTGTDTQARATAQQEISQSLAQLGLNELVRVSSSEDAGLRYWLDHSTAAAWTPAYDTLTLGQRVAQEFPQDDHQLQRQTLLAMLASPTAYDFPNVSELTAALRIRQAIVQAAKKTALAFKTSSAERPEDFWTYHEDTGFTVRPSKALALALQKATQPEVSGKLYSFSCYRASEYVILLALAQELPCCNPALAQRLQSQWERKAIMSAQFHDVFLREYGSMEQPVPPRYYVPGDRLWFRNPDEASADATGYEGS